MSTPSLRSRGGLITLILLALLAAVYLFGGQTNSSTSQPIPPSLVAQPVGDLPNMPIKPQPKGITFDGCPPEGEGGDPELNLLKNRVDEGNYVPVSFDSLLLLTWPKSAEQRDMANWPPESRAFIAQYEGIPVRVEGYVVNVRESGPESANCNHTGGGYVDWHIFFTKNPRDDRSQAVIAEATPRVRFNHKWTMDLMRSLIVNDHLPVRISGWLFFNPQHPDDVGKTRATLWEIQPVMQIEVFQNGRWIPLDKIAD